MAFPRRERAYIPAEVVSNPSILGGEPCVSGTRVPAMTIIEELREGRKDSAIVVDYPSLPFDGIEAVRLWAKQNAIPFEPTR